MLFMNEFEILGMTLSLRLLSNAISNDLESKKYFIEWNISSNMSLNKSNKTGHPLVLLTNLISQNMIMPLHLKAQVLDTITSFMDFSNIMDNSQTYFRSQISLIVWNTMLSSNLLMNTLTSTNVSSPKFHFYFKTILDEVESCNLEEYPLSISFLNFLNEFFASTMSNPQNFRIFFIDRYLNPIKSIGGDFEISHNVITLYIIYICENFLMPLYSRSYKVPLEKWKLGGLCLKFLSSFVQVCVDYRINQNLNVIDQYYDPIMYYLTNPLQYLLAQLLNQGPISQIIYYILKQGVSIINEEINDNNANQYDTENSWILKKCCVPALKLILNLNNHKVNGLRDILDMQQYKNIKFESHSTSHSSSFTSSNINDLRDLLIFPHLELFIRFICESYFNAPESSKNIEQSLLSLYILKSLNNGTFIDANKLAHCIDSLITQSGDQKDKSQKMIVFGFSQIFDSYYKFLDIYKTGQNKACHDTTSLFPSCAVYNFMGLCYDISISENIRDKCLIIPIILIKLLLSGQDDIIRDKPLSKFALFLLGIGDFQNSSLNMESLFIYQVKPRTCLDALLDLADSSPWLLTIPSLNGITTSFGKESIINSHFSSLLYALLHKLALQPNTYIKFLTYLRTRDLNHKIKFEISDNSYENSGETETLAWQNHYTLHLIKLQDLYSTLSFLKESISIPNDDQPKDFDPIYLTAGIYIRLAFFLKYFSVEINQCLTQLLPSYLLKYTRALFKETITDGSSSLMKLLQILQFEDVKLYDNDSLDKYLIDTIDFNQFKILLEKHCSISDVWGITYFDEKAVLKYSYNYFENVTKNLTTDVSEKCIKFVLDHIQRTNIMKYLRYSKNIYLGSLKNVIKLMITIIQQPIFIWSQRTDLNFNECLKIYCQLSLYLIKKGCLQNVCQNLTPNIADILFSCTTFLKNSVISQIREIKNLLTISNTKYAGNIELLISSTESKVLGETNRFDSDMAFLFSQLLEGTIELIIEPNFSSTKCRLNLYGCLLTLFDMAIECNLMPLNQDIFLIFSATSLHDVYNSTERYLEYTLKILNTHLTSNFFVIISRDACNKNGDLIQIMALNILRNICKLETLHPSVHNNSYDQQIFVSGKWMSKFYQSGYLQDLINITSSYRKQDKTLNSTEFFDNLDATLISCVCEITPKDIISLHLYKTRMALLENFASTKFGANTLIESNFILKLRDMKIFDVRYELSLFGNESKILSTSYNIPDAESKFTDFILIPTFKLIKVLLCSNMIVQHNMKTCLQVVDFWMNHRNSLTFNINSNKDKLLLKNEKLAVDSTIIELELITFIISLCIAILNGNKIY
ncbi:uncharacterized protein LOC135928702 [Gordionus sp. m RMFG-2023]|uniref:uncharacterized protein LOC135928702 n=1 Tax=Gordionus sp. m RMFG-2023 TaxID=3053472 RepID=UPI0031FDB580